MAFKVFLSYGIDPAEQVTAWRLQTLAAAHGITVLVPQRNGTRGKAVSDEVQSAVNQSDCVLAIITGQVGAAVQQELKYALSKGKIVIPIVQTGAEAPAFLKKHIFRFSPGNPGDVENEVIQYLKEQELS